MIVIIICIQYVVQLLLKLLKLHVLQSNVKLEIKLCTNEKLLSVILLLCDEYSF